ncbi:MAG: sugar phosphate nucleotidyltransferase [Candidatus Midichloria sp.]
MCGGEGSRLWPLSNPSKPKQFISLPGMSYTLLQSTLIRLKEAEYFNPPIIIVQECFISYVEEQIKQFNIEVGHIIMESQANGTAFAAALATLLINKNSDSLNEEMILIVPIDHYLEDAQELFNKIYFLAAKSHNKITVFGLHPQRKETRYGYIQVEKDANFKK